MKREIELVIGKFRTELDPDELTTVINHWQEAVRLFRDLPFAVRRNDGVTRVDSRVTLDMQTVADALPAMEGEANSVPLTIRCTLETEDTLSDEEVRQAVVYLVQQFFLTMNLSCPGACSMQDTAMRDSGALYALSGLSAQPIKNAQRGAAEFGWPKITRLEPGTVWEWLNKVKLSQMDVAFSPAPMALFGLLKVAEQTHHFGPGDIILLYQVVMALCEADAHTSEKWLRQRLHLVLGQPDARSDAFGDLHRRYLQALEGHRPMVRPGIGFTSPHTALQQQLGAHNSPVERALMLLVALLQDLIIHDAKNYQFAETFYRHHGSE